MAVEPDCMHSSLGMIGSLFYSFPVVPLFDLASRFKVHSSPAVHATGSTVCPASRVTELSNRYVVTLTKSREDGHYVYIVQVGNVGDTNSISDFEIVTW